MNVRHHPETTCAIHCVIKCINPVISYGLEHKHTTLCWLMIQIYCEIPHDYCEFMNHLWITCATHCVIKCIILVRSYGFRTQAHNIVFVNDTKMMRNPIGLFLATISCHVPILLAVVAVAFKILGALTLALDRAIVPVVLAALVLWLLALDLLAVPFLPSPFLPPLSLPIAPTCNSATLRSRLQHNLPHTLWCMLSDHRHPNLRVDRLATVPLVLRNPRIPSSEIFFELIRINLPPHWRENSNQHRVAPDFQLVARKVAPSDAMP